MGKVIENFFGGVTRTTEMFEGTKGSVIENFFAGQNRETSHDYGNLPKPDVSITPIAAAVTMVVGQVLTFSELFKVVGATAADFDVVSGTPANVSWDDATGATAVKAGASTITATGKTGGVADGLSAAVSSTVVAALAWGTHPASGTIGTAVGFTFTGGIPLVDGNKYKVIVLKPDGTEHDNSNQTATTYSLVTSAGDAVGSYTVMVFDKGVKQGTTDPVDGGSKISQAVTMAAAPKVFKIANGTATVTGGNAVALVAADGMKTILATDSSDAAVPGAAATLKTAGDSTKMTVALNADGKTVELTPVAGQTGPVIIQIKATGYTTKEITVTLS
ncbi:hypothetical protein [Citrobacter sp.]|uniref:hypothetical protein n=1 Tax=Citrobacter sp. TaxID=1896336 RepID=UPI002FCB1157